ncbi:MAG: hypothetical protein HYX64_11520 [Gammaproteobacteria bacterium]|nr:hypothetical protein [Gammaproteobacteria bacterium]
MNEEQLFQLYEKLYFHELDRREKISARLNMPLAVLVAVTGFLSYMLQNQPERLEGWFELAFWVMYISAAIAAGSSAWFFRKAWFGHTDKLLPTANETEGYRRQCIDLYAEYDECDTLVAQAMKQYLYDYYMRFSTENTINNDSRAYSLYRATASVTGAVLLAFAAFVPFFLCDHLV